jgi:hypothetical protein
MSRNPDPARSPGAPMAGNPGGVRVRTGHITARHPHPAAVPPIPEAWGPHHSSPGWWRNRFLLQWRRRGGRSAVSGARVSRRLRWARVSRRLRWAGVSRRLRRTRIARRRILLGGGRRQQCQQDCRDCQKAALAPGSSNERYRDHSDFHRVDRLFSPLSNARSCRVVSCPRTGSAMACSRLCAPFHSVDGRTCPSLPI